MFKSFSSIAVAAALLTGVSGDAIAAKIVKPKAVIEVFTSQGCYSCPPADKLVEKLSATNEILAISTHVDYWDYLGWKDIFASKTNTQRQYGYARALKESQVYTPQAVINGVTHEVGSRERRVLGTADRLEKTGSGMVVPLDLKIDGNTLNISVGDHSAADGATLYIVSMKSSQSVKIDRGENAGKTITYHNILRDMQPLGMLKPGGLELQYPIAELKRGDSDSFAILLQHNDANGNPSEIVGAVYIDDL